MLRVSYEGRWPPESKDEGTTKIVSGKVTKVVLRVQLENAAKMSGHLKHNPGPQDIRKCTAISVWIDPSTASIEELENFKLLRPDGNVGTLYIAASLLADLNARDFESADAAVDIGDIIEAQVDPQKAPYAHGLRVTSRAKRSKIINGGITHMYTPNAPVDCDTRGFADNIMKAKAALLSETASTTNGQNEDVADDEWDE